MVHKAIREVMESTPKGVQAIADPKIIDNLGVEHMDGQDPTASQDAPNWNNLANFLKIEKGVDNLRSQTCWRKLLEHLTVTMNGDPAHDPSLLFTQDG